MAARLGRIKGRITAGDLNGDGRIDIVAVGRQTHNIRIYWNEEVRK